MKDTQSSIVGRLAPSPTGLLHLGSAWAFLLAFVFARSQSGTVVLRIEDIDPQRSKKTFIESILFDLKWLGIEWDRDPYFQSTRLDLYEDALALLAQKKVVYPCFCTRKELKLLACAPHTEDIGTLYPGTCRNLSDACVRKRIEEGALYSLRFACPNEPCIFSDTVYGTFSLMPSDFGGDFAVKRSDGVISYQLAVAVDDALMGVNQVVRGRDILYSTPKQMLIQKFLGLERLCEYIHIPLLLDPLGERLAKRHASLSLQYLRKEGVRPERIIGFLCHLAGITETFQTLNVRDLIGFLSPSLLPKKDIQLPENYHKFLCSG